MEKPSSKNCDVTRGHEHYLCHILLLGQASPIALKAIIEREKKNCGKDIGILLNEYRDAFKTGYETEYLQLFQEDHVNDDIDTWDTLQLCAVTLVLFKSDLADPEIKAIQYIYDQRKDIEKYAKYASLSFKTYKEKQDLVHEQLLELMKLINQSANYNCKRMMYSIEPESMNLNESQVCKLTGTKDVKTHLQVAIEVKFETQNTLTGEDNTQVLQTNEGQEMAESSNIEMHIGRQVINRNHDAPKKYVGREAIERTFDALKKYMHPDPVIACKTNFVLLTDTDKNNIKSNDLTDKNHTILRKVKSKGAKGYTDFKERLKKTRQTELLELINCAENGQDTKEIENRLAVLWYIKHKQGNSMC